MTSKQLKAIPSGKKLGWTVIEFYVHPTLGECHTNYFHDVLASSAEMAVKFVQRFELVAA
jgi:hypothetical protein